MKNKPRKNCIFARKSFPRFETYPKILYSTRLSYDISEIQH